MGDPDDRREFTRVPSWLGVELEHPTGGIVRGRARDIGLRGVFVFTDTLLPAGTELAVNLLLGDAPGDPRILAQGRVVRVEPGGVGLEFSSIELESFTHLQQFIRYNAEDPGIVEREIDGHVGLARRAG